MDTIEKKKTNSIVSAPSFLSKTKPESMHFKILSYIVPRNHLALRASSYDFQPNMVTASQHQYLCDSMFLKSLFWRLFKVFHILGGINRSCSAHISVLSNILYLRPSSARDSNFTSSSGIICCLLYYKQIIIVDVTIVAIISHVTCYI